MTIEGIREDGLKGYIREKVEPSKRVHPGIYIQINDHYETEESSIGCEKMISVLESAWIISNDKSDLIISNILKLN